MMGETSLIICIYSELPVQMNVQTESRVECLLGACFISVVFNIDNISMTIF